MSLKRLYIFACILAFGVACDKKVDSNKDGEILAEYKGKYLYKTDIPDDILNKFREGDSTGLLKSYVDKWLESQVMVAVAENSLTDEEKNKDKLIEDYRNSLLIYEYQQKLMKEKLDTAVTEQEINAFYNENINTFQLRKNIVKIRYVKIGSQNSGVNKIKRLIQSNDGSGSAELKTLAEKEADNFYLDSTWLYLDDITKEIPLDANYDQQRFLSNNKYIQIEEKNVLYLVYIMDFRIKNAISPLEFEREKIKDIILYRRKLEFLKATQKSVFDGAVKSGDIKYHLKQ